MERSQADQVLAAWLGSQGRPVTRADLVGVWRYKETDRIRWDSGTRTVSNIVRDMVMTLAADGTFRFESESGMAMGLFVTPDTKGRWSLVGDTLVVDMAADTQPQWTVLSRAPGKVLTMMWADPAMFPIDFWRVDSVTSLPPLTPQPPTVKPEGLEGTWTTEFPAGVPADTITFRRDGTWTAGAVHGVSIHNCDISNSDPSKGKWHIGPENVLVLTDALDREICTNFMFKLEGPRMVSYNPLRFFDRIGAPKP